jgi:hypothetical protein
MIDQCQYCGHYAYLRRHAGAYLCAQCLRHRGASVLGCRRHRHTH